MGSRLVVKRRSNKPLSSLNECKDEHKKYVFEGIFTPCDGQENRNGRIYDRDEVLKHLSYLREKIREDGGILGELDHPEGRFEIYVQESSHIVKDLWYSSKDQAVMGRLELLDTPKGKIAKAMVDAGYPLFVSSRAAGTVGADKHVSIQQIFTWDIVAQPGFKNCRLDQVSESMRSQLTTFLNEAASTPKSDNKALEYGIEDESFQLIETQEVPNITETIAENVDIDALSKPLTEEIKVTVTAEKAKELGIDTSSAGEGNTGDTKKSSVTLDDIISVDGHYMEEGQDQVKDIQPEFESPVSTQDSASTAQTQASPTMTNTNESQQVNEARIMEVAADKYLSENIPMDEETKTYSLDEAKFWFAENYPNMKAHSSVFIDTLRNRGVVLEHQETSFAMDAIVDRFMNEVDPYDVYGEEYKSWTYEDAEEWFAREYPALMAKGAYGLFVDKLREKGGMLESCGSAKKPKKGEKAEDDATEYDEKKDISETDDKCPKCGNSPCTCDEDKLTAKKNQLKEEIDVIKSFYGGVVEDIKKASEMRESIIADFPFTVSLSPENFDRFSSLNPNQREMCKNYVWEAQVFDPAKINEIWDRPIIDEKNLSEGYLKFAHPVDVELYLRQDIDTKQKIDEMAKFFDINDKASANDFWRMVGLRDKAKNNISNETEVNAFNKSMEVNEDVEEYDDPLLQAIESWDRGH